MLQMAFKKTGHRPILTHLFTQRNANYLEKIAQYCVQKRWAISSVHASATASEMTYILSSGALNSTHSLMLAPVEKRT